MATIIPVLKITGIVLLCILALVLLLILLILFVPVRYRVRGSYSESVDVKGYVSYLLHIVHVSLRYTDELRLTLHIFGIPIRLMPKKEKKKKQSRDKEPEDIKKNKSQPDSEKADKPKHDNEKADSKKDVDRTDKDKEDENKRDKNAGNSSDTKTDVNRESDKKSKGSEKDKADADKKTGIEKIKAYIKLLDDPDTRGAWQVAKKRTGRLLKTILPKRIRILIRYGLDDPYVTAQIMSVYNVFYTYIGEGLTLMPVYYEKHTEADGYIRGYIMVAPILWQALLTVLNRDCRSFFKKFKNINSRTAGRS